MIEDTCLAAMDDHQLFNLSRDIMPPESNTYREIG